ncbi:MAG TPA: DMT family transporter [Deltaproteobacteria bacterium]|nr:DMT family transporter [Deltaproteobacteria bacterium]
MAWLLSLISAFTLATADALTKKYFSSLSSYEMGLIRLIAVVPWIVAAMFFIPWVMPDTVFFVCLALGLPLEVLAYISYMRAIKVSPLSLSLPFLAFTPIFIILTGWLILGETLTWSGLAGIVLITGGAYCLNFSRISAGPLSPLKSIFTEEGSRLMLMVAALYSVTAALGKLAIEHSNPYTFGVVYQLALTALIALGVPFLTTATLKNIGRRPLMGLALGAVVFISEISHWIAISQTQAAYMIALKRTSILFAVLYGAWLFREEHVRERLVGALIMLCGVVCIAAFG